MKKTLIYLLGLYGTLLSVDVPVFAQEHPLVIDGTTNVKVYFRQGQSGLDTLYHDNGTHLDSLV